MCTALSAILAKGERPKYLCKPSDDKLDHDDNGGQDDGLNKKHRKRRNPKDKKKKKPKDKELGQSFSSDYALENAAKKKSASHLLGSARVIVQLLVDYWHLFSMQDRPSSSYSCLLIHSCWKVPKDARIEPPIHPAYFLSVDIADA
jgi:hypothetical protein